MHAKITTTVTTYVDVSTFGTTHEVEVDADGLLPESAVIAAVSGGLKSALAAVSKRGAEAGDEQ